MSQPPTIQLKDFCKLFGFEDRQVRFILEQGFVPKGVAERPSTGNRREFGPSQAFWLAIAVLLKSNGLKTSTAVEIADITSKGIQMVAQNLSWEPTFLPMKGRFDTDHSWYLDIGDLKLMRIVTDANPSKSDLYEFDWQPVSGRSKIHRGLAPFVVLRLDLTQIARVLARVDGWSPQTPVTSEE